MLLSKGYAETCELIRDVLSRLTSASFKLTAPGSYPIARDTVKWFMWCPEIVEMRENPYLSVVWADQDNLYLDSMPLGNTVDWIEDAYGEDAIHELLQMDFTGLSGVEIQRILEGKFPLVSPRINAYLSISRDFASESKVDLGVTFRGRRGIVTYRLRVVIGARSLDSESIVDKIMLAVKTLREAWSRIEKHELQIIGSVSSE